MAQRQTEEAMEATQQTTTDPAIMAAVGSVALSWYFFFARGNREMGLFVGLWPPTILAFASYFKQTRMSTMMDRAMGKSTIGQSVKRVVGQS